MADVQKSTAVSTGLTKQSAGTLVGIRSIEDFDLKDKRVFLRLDLNVPIKNGKITDLTRIKAALPTIRYAIDHGAKLVVASHLGRPETPEDRAKYSLEPVAGCLGDMLNCDVILVEEPESDAPKALLRGLKPNQFILLENLRFNDDEAKNGEGLSLAIAQYVDIYINDAFGSSHRAHSSIVSLPTKIVKKGIGFLMKKEIEMLDRVIKTPEAPFIAILGGAKVADKVGVIENLIDRVDVFLIGGAMAYTFLAAQDIKLGQSRVEKDKLKYARELLARIDARKKKILLPLDHQIVTKFDSAKDLKTTSTSAIPDGWMGVDIGPKTTALFCNELVRAKTVFWNGPMGIFETAEFSKGTFAVARALAELKEATTIVGGGDSAAAINASGFADQVTHISTGGGASLEFLQGDKLPGIEALRS